MFKYFAELLSTKIDKQERALKILRQKTKLNWYVATF